MQAQIFDIKRDCSEDGPGIRTTVFFHGCPLNCLWCQNPEGKNANNIIHFHPPKDSTGEQSHAIGTRRNISLDDLLYRVCIDKPFFNTTGGGVTLSGGEATQQMPFVHAFLKHLKQQNIHTTLETSGFFNYRKFCELLLPCLDLIYYDIKLIDDTLHRHYTGQTNALILRNLTRLSRENRSRIVPRIPLIPGITTTKENLQGIAKFLRNLGFDNAILLNYNPLWLDKLPHLGITSQYQRRSFMTKEEIKLCIDYFNADGTAIPYSDIYHSRTQGANA